MSALPQGAYRCGTQAVRWQLWAPCSESVSLVRWPASGCVETPMAPQPGGYFSCERPGVEEGQRYAYRLADGREYPDPASRWQPDGVHCPSAVFFPDDFAWSDETWRGIEREELVLYELHVGTFSPEGTFAGVLPRLPELRALGVTALELMPVAQFPGQRNWGYDGVFPYAVQHSYGGPRGLQQLVDAAHTAGLAVILDVVCNHLGNEGNYLAKFAPYFTDRYRTPWSGAVNFDGPDSDAVRQYILDNARQWIRDFHLDGLRLDAVQTMYDLGPRHILAEIQEAVERAGAAAGRAVHVMAESNQNDTRLVASVARGGFGLGAVWSDDFHHSLHAWLTGERDGYYQDFGDPQHVAKALESIFVYDGCYSQLHRRRHGSQVGDLDRSRFVICIQNHDQVGNRARGDRLGSLVPPAAQRLACGLLLLSPCTPLLFMGEEYGESRPFPFFCSFGDPKLVAAVRRGRRDEFAALAFHWGGEIPDPQAFETFASAQLTWSWPEGSRQAGLRYLYQDLLTARRQWTPLRDRQHTTARLVSGRSAQGEEPPLLVVERGAGDSLLACANLAPVETPLAVDVDGRQAVLSTEQPRYGGERSLAIAVQRLAPYELILFASRKGRP